MRLAGIVGFGQPKWSSVTVVLAYWGCLATYHRAHCVVHDAKDIFSCGQKGICLCGISSTCPRGICICVSITYIYIMLQLPFPILRMEMRRQVISRLLFKYTLSISPNCALHLSATSAIWLRTPSCMIGQKSVKREQAHYTDQ